MAFVQVVQSANTKFLLRLTYWVLIDRANERYYKSQLILTVLPTIKAKLKNFSRQLFSLENFFIWDYFYSSFYCYEIFFWIKNGYFIGKHSLEKPSLYHYIFFTVFSDCILHFFKSFFGLQHISNAKMKHQHPYKYMQGSCGRCTFPLTTCWYTSYFNILIAMDYSFLICKKSNFNFVKKTTTCNQNF